MKNVKMSLANIQGKLSRSEMRNVMAGSGYSADACAAKNCDDCTSKSTGTLCDKDGKPWGKITFATLVDALLVLHQ